MTRPLFPLDDEPLGEVRRRARTAAALFLVVHPLYTLLQLACVLVIPLPEGVDLGVLTHSCVANAILDVATVAFLVFVEMSPRFRRNPRNLLQGATFGIALVFMSNWALQAHYGGTQSSHMLTLVMGTLVVFSWLLPPRGVVALAAITTAILLAVTSLEMQGLIPYSPILSIGEIARERYLDARITVMNGAVFLCTLVLVLWTLLRMRLALAASHRALQLNLDQLEQESMERDRAQQTLRRAVEELTTKNEVLRGFLRGAAHDLRSPLAAVGGFATLLKKDLGDGKEDKARDHLDRVEDAVQHMASLLDDLSRLVLAGQVEPTLQPCDPAQVIHRVLGFVADDLAASGGRVDVGEMPLVLADEARLTQILQNLVSNAIKYRSEAPPLIRIFAVEEGSSYRFMIRDNGIGFAPNQRDRLFKPFERLAPVGHDGNGIGLSVCRALVQSMGGRIGAEREPDGSTFWFTLKAAQRP